MSDRRQQRGVTLIEVLVAILVSSIGLLGMVALQLRAYAADVESYQRANALVLLQDMVNRINANRASALAYVAADVGTGAVQDCTTVAGLAAQDLCQWGNLLRGQTEQRQGSLVGAMQLARGCISAAAPNAYIVAVVWQGVTPTGAPRAACGAGAYGDERLRRAVTAVVQIATLG